MKPCENRQRGFTLIELLVVMAVLGLLIAIIAPTFARVLPIVRRVHCAADLRSIAAGYTARQEEQHLVRMGPDMWAASLLVPYLGGNADVLLCQSDSVPHHGYQDIKLDVTYRAGAGDIHVPHVRDIFATYPYWLAGDCGDPGPGIWKLNDEDYAAFMDPDSQAYAPTMLHRYEPGNDPNVYWFVVEEGGDGEHAGSDVDYNDFAMRVEQLPDERLRVTCENFWHAAMYDFIMANGSQVPGIAGVSLGEGAYTGPFYFELTTAMSYGINWQGAKIRGGQRRIIFADYEKEVCYVGGYSTIIDIWAEAIAPRHMGRVNIALADGGVINVDPDEIDPQGPDSEAIDAAWWSPTE